MRYNLKPFTEYFFRILSSSTLRYALIMEFPERPSSFTINLFSLLRSIPKHLHIHLNEHFLSR